MNDEMPPANLILQALHAIRSEAQKTNQQLAQTNERLEHFEASTNQRLDATNERLDNLRIFTVQGLTDLNRKMDEGFNRIDARFEHVDQRLERMDHTLNQHTSELQLLNARFDNILTGEIGRRLQRFDSLENEVRRLAAKVDH